MEKAYIESNKGLQIKNTILAQITTLINNRKALLETENTEEIKTMLKNEIRTLGYLWSDIERNVILECPEIRV